MKNILWLTLAVICMASLSFAQDAVMNEQVPLEPAMMNQAIAPVEVPGEAPEAEAIILKGDILDNKCAEANKTNLAEFVKTHTKECTLMPDCVASGYAIYADGELQKFDKDSNVKIEEFLKKPDSKLQVVIIANKVDEELSLISIANQ